MAQEHLRQTVCLDLEFMPLDILDALPQFCIRVVMSTIGIQILFALDGIGSTKYEESGIAQFMLHGYGYADEGFLKPGGYRSPCRTFVEMMKSQRSMKYA